LLVVATPFVVDFYIMILIPAMLPPAFSHAIFRLFRRHAAIVACRRQLLPFIAIRPRYHCYYAITTSHYCHYYTTFDCLRQPTTCLMLISLFCLLCLMLFTIMPARLLLLPRIADVAFIIIYHSSYLHHSNRPSDFTAAI